MGREKAALELGGRTLLEHALCLAQEVADEVRLVGDPRRLPSSAKIVEDRYPGSGPLAGIHAALLASNTDLNLILPVDMPFLEPAFLRFLLAEAERSGALVTVPRLETGWQPLCAVYRKAFAGAAERALSIGQNKIDPLFAQVTARVIEEGELLRMDFPLQMFDNLNTPEEWQRAQHRFAERP